MLYFEGKERPSRPVFSMDHPAERVNLFLSEDTHGNVSIHRMTVLRQYGLKREQMEIPSVHGYPHICVIRAALSANDVENVETNTVKVYVFAVGLCSAVYNHVIDVKFPTPPKRRKKGTVKTI